VRLDNLAFPEAIDPKFKNVDASSGTVDIEYNLVEKDLANRTSRRLWRWVYWYIRAIF
jgi:hypothetical protein